MTKINDGDRVNPIFRQARAADYRVKNMLLRDWFAGLALSGMMANCDSTGMNGWLPGHDHAASYAYAVADAMLAARSGGQDDE